MLLDHVFESILSERLIVCEGYSDACFIKALLKRANIANCNIGCPSDKGGHGQGVTAIPRYLASVRGVIQKGSAPNLNGILVVPDADKHPNKCFADMVTALTDSEFPAPTKPFSVEGDNFKTAIFIMPGDGEEGTLEHLLWNAAILQNPKLATCVDGFFLCLGNQEAKANDNKKLKMKVSSLIGGVCYENPWSSAALIWKQENNPVPIDSPVFDQLNNFLHEFAA